MNDIQIRMKWNGKEVTVEVVKPLTDEQYQGLKVAPSSLAYLIMENAYNVLALTGHMAITEVEET